jgi:chromosome segregation ATPase
VEPGERDSSVFNEPIPADLPRRQFDRKLLEAYDADHERIRNISSRQTRIEVVLENVQRDIKRLEQQQSEMVTHLDRVASSMSAITNKLSVHTEMEEYQWTQVNKANETITTVGKALENHLKESGILCERVAWIEKLFFLFITVFGVMGFIVMGDEIIRRFGFGGG